MYRADNDVGHLGIKQMLDILLNQFYWPNLENEATQHIRLSEPCLMFKGRLDKEKLYLLLAMYPLELVHMDFLTIENPCTGGNGNILVITTNFSQYAKAVATPTKMNKATSTAFWNEFITNYGFLKKC